MAELKLLLVAIKDDVTYSFSKLSVLISAMSVLLNALASILRNEILLKFVYTLN